MTDDREIDTPVYTSLMFLKFDTEQFLRETSIVDEQGNARPGFESHVALQRALDVYEETIVAAGHGSLM